jgi:hypothetical protein
MRQSTITENVKHDFGPVEFQDLGRRLAEATQKVDDLTQTKKQIVKDYDAQIEAQKADVLVLSRKLTNGYEMQRTECWVRYHDPVQAKKTIIRKDTGEVVRVEDMTPSECQEVLFEEPTAKETEAVSTELATLHGEAMLESETFNFRGKTVSIGATIYQTRQGWNWKFAIVTKAASGGNQESISGSDTEKPFADRNGARVGAFGEIHFQVLTAWRRNNGNLSKEQVDDARRICSWSEYIQKHPDEARDGGHPELEAGGQQS